ncbi:sensor histidine kinase [Gracilibacillus kekensis]|uniref:Two-component system, sensor histidine kinase YesM n=1 Tax=Gracilibacillus kekensis TaxID=1027249 RepID=A0A1M7QTA3_9BACI|nr:histidine kinase [Gracilibacillus kekensis]SHN35060.1 two-component system, sensor histidine kinase YesM [Gracilibacillus kekensis]
MKRQRKIFHRLLLLVLMIIIPVTGLFLYSNQVSLKTVNNQIEISQLNQLKFLSHQIETNINKLTESAITLHYDPSIKLYRNQHVTNDLYSSIWTKRNIEQKLQLQQASGNWKNEMAMYFPRTKTVISPKLSRTYDLDQLKLRVDKEWTYEKSEGSSVGDFVKFILAPSYTSVNNLSSASLITEIVFSEKNIQDILDDYKVDGQNDPILFHSSSDIIYNRSIDEEESEKLKKAISSNMELFNKDTANNIIKIADQKYLFTHIKLESLGWYLIDYTPLDIVVSPINEIRQIYYAIVGFLIFLSILSILYIYKTVQVPIKKLLKGVESVKQGDYSVRIIEQNNNEFGYLLKQFNQMAYKIQNLIQTVYEERVRAKEATVKQLQSQINPHFLYNCLAYMKSMARLNRNEMVEKMCLHLGGYYRYTTRTDEEMVNLEEELNLVENYVEIYNLKTNKIRLTINIPEEMKKIKIPRLLIQPIVENCIVHGLELKEDDGLISISGELCNENYLIRIKDNGKGMANDEISILQGKLNTPLQNEMGCGIWNVHQRLKLKFGEESGVKIINSSPSGFIVDLTWHKKGEW